MTQREMEVVPIIVEYILENAFTSFLSETTYVQRAAWIFCIIKKVAITINEMLPDDCDLVFQYYHSC